MLDEAMGIGVEAVTDRFGRATVDLCARAVRLKAIYADPCTAADPRLVERGLRRTRHGDRGARD